MLKYSPEHMHCLATVWGPLAPPNTGAAAGGLWIGWAFRCSLALPNQLQMCLQCHGLLPVHASPAPFSLPWRAGVLAVQKLDGQQANWRIAATGVVLQLDASLRIVKKLKLVGTPFKVGMGWVQAAWLVVNGLRLGVDAQLLAPPPPSHAPLITAAP